MTQFDGQVAVVTGASSGIGRAIARKLAKLGATVCLIGRKMETLESVMREDAAISFRFRCYQADLSLVSNVQEMSHRIKRDLKVVNLLIHCAGVISGGKVENASVKNLDRQYSVNVRAPYYLTQRFLPLLRQSHGQIVFVNSSVVLREAKGGASQYSATKFALKALADSLRDEVNSDGIRVMTVYPGRTASSMQKRIHKLEGKEYRPERLLQPDDIATAIISALAMPSTSEMTDISIRPFMKPVA
jgi:short-subunit dehydrogenase